MRKLFFALFFLFSIITYSKAQETSIKGKITDTLEKKNLPNGVISLLYKKDSSLAKFSRSDKNGQFTIRNVDSGKYILLVTYPKFADYVDEVAVHGKDVDLGMISLTQTSILLKEVIVRSGQAIRIKGDTTEFIADSFAVKEGATVEDLLKKLPGFQVNSKGEITAQGQRVQKVLVDGEEFFGDDPTMATQNISAKAVDKVQVFDTKSEQQQLTGISTGNEGKTVNIKLKEDQKRGGFGKIAAGTDFTKFLDARLLYNRFTGKKKISAYATKTNVNAGSLNWEDRQKLGVEDDYEYDEIGGYYFSFGSSDDFNDWSLRGLPNAYTAGALFSNKWNADKNNLNLSYRFNRLGTTSVNSTLTQNILPQGITYSNRYTNTIGLNQQHALNGKYEWKIDSLTSLKLTTAIIFKTTDLSSDINSEYLDSMKQFINKSSSINNNHTQRVQSDNVLTYKQMFKKKNRLLLATVRYGTTNDQQNGNNNTQIKYYENGLYNYTDTVDQQKIMDGQSTTIGTKITYSEPLSGKWNLVVDYSYNKNHSVSKRNTFEKGFNDKYEVLNPAFSNNFDLNAFSHGSTVVMRYIGKKLKLAFGSGISNVKLQLLDLDSSKTNTYNFFKITPQAQVGYAIKQQSNITFNYRGTTHQPTLSQLQPLVDNNDPLNVFKGNPNLKVGFNHNFNMFYYQYKVLSSAGIWLSSNYNIEQNTIANYSVIDSQGKRIYSPVNVNGNRNWSFWGNWSKGNGEKKLRHGIQLNGNGGRNVNFINAQKSINTYTNFQLRVNLGYDFPDKYSFELGPKIGHTSSKSSLRSDINNNYFSYGGNAEGFIMLPWKLELNSDVDFDLRQHIAAFAANTNLIIWNASISRKFFKDKSGKIGFYAYDILDQNKGFTRTINSIFVSDESYQRISRYFLLKFEWSFNKVPGGK
jgi:Outer membrane protein beta-barrel family